MKHCLDCNSIKSRKGLYCKNCGYKHRTRPRGLKYRIKVINKTWFKKGDISWMKGRFGSKNPVWKGDDVGYDGLHIWIERKLGKPKVCEICGTIKAKVFEWSNKSGKYLRDFNDWQRLCKKCHHRYDFENFGARKVFYL